MEHYAGIDVSLESASVCVVDATGRIVREAKVASEPEVLTAWFRGLGISLSRIGLEAGPLSQWLYAGMREAGLPDYSFLGWAGVVAPPGHGSLGAISSGSVTYTPTGTYAGPDAPAVETIAPSERVLRLSLCSIPHRAYDQDLVGISPGYDVHVAARLLDDRHRRVEL